MVSGTQLVDDMNACRLNAGECAFWWLGQHGFAVKFGDAVVYVDAFVSPLKGRTVAPLLRPEEMTNAVAILGTHDHIDHIDRPSWPGMSKAAPAAKFVVPRRVMESVMGDLSLGAGRVIGLDAGESAEVAGVKITAVPAAHELIDQDPLTGWHRYVGYVLESDGCCVYHAGDTCIYEGMQATLRHWKIDVAFLPINGRDAVRLSRNCIGNMTYQEAVDLAGAIKPRLVVPTHFEMFSGNSENPKLFADYLAVKYPAIKMVVPTHGERVLVEAR